MNILDILKSYKLKNISIWVLGWHSALDVCTWAKKYGFKTVCVAKKWRDLPYSKYYKVRGDKWCIDECIVVDQWSDLLKNETQDKLRKLNTIFIHSRYFWVYFDFKQIEDNFRIPIFGSRGLLKLEERDVEKNQYYLLEKAWIRIPKIWKVPALEVDELWELKIVDKIFLNSQNRYRKLCNEHVYLNNGVKRENKNTKQCLIKFKKKKDELIQYAKEHWLIERLSLTKVNNATRTYERENFVAWSWDEWIKIANEKIINGRITLDALQNSVIEEFVLWAQINFNFFYSNLTWELELLWTDTRRQTSLDWLLRLPANEQKKIPDYKPYHIETWHIAVTCKESLLEKAFKAGEDFVASCKKNAQELIWPFALQWAIETDWKKEELVVFDVSMRIPWSPWIWATPYSWYLFWRSVSMWERVAMEIKDALDAWKIEDILT